MVKFVSNPIAGIKKQSYIVMSFPYSGVNHGWLKRLVDQQLSGKHDAPISGIEYTIALFCLYKYLEFKLNGSALDAMRTKFASVTVNFRNDEAILNFSTDPSFSAVRKVLSVTGKNLDPAKLGPIYKKYMVALGQKVDESHMMACFHSLATGIKSGLSCYVTGMFKVPDGKAKELEESVAEIAKSVTVGAAGKKPSEHKEHPNTHAVKIGSSAVDVLIAHQLLHSMQIETTVLDNELICHAGCNPMGKVDLARIDRFVNLKLAKLGDKLLNVLILLGAQSGFVSAGDLAKIPKPTDAMLLASLKKAFLS